MKPQLGNIIKPMAYVIVGVNLEDQLARAGIRLDEQSAIVLPWTNRSKLNLEIKKYCKRMRKKGARKE